MLLLNSHPIFLYFPFLDKLEVCPRRFKKFVLKELEMVRYDPDFKNLSTFKSLDHLNFRAPLSIPYFLKDNLKNKNIFHIGSRKGELDILFCKYAKKVISCKIDKNIERLHEIPNNLEYYNKDYKEIIEKIIDIDIYYFWCGYELDILILDDLINNHNKKGIFYITLPNDGINIEIFLSRLRNWYDKQTNLSIDYTSVLFDESNRNIINETEFTNNNKIRNWCNWKIFDNMRGVWVLLKIIKI